MRYVTTPPIQSNDTTYSKEELANNRIVLECFGDHADIFVVQYFALVIPRPIVLQSKNTNRYHNNRNQEECVRQIPYPNLNQRRVVRLETRDNVVDPLIVAVGCDTN